MKQAFVETYHISKTFNAPLGFVYRWCTDFREDDPKMVGAKYRRKITERSNRLVAWRIVGRRGQKGYEGVRVVWLKPPNAWHLDTCGDRSEQGDYRLTRLGKTKTRLDMRFTVAYADRSSVAPKKSWEQDLSKNWDSYGSYLERDYRRSLRAR